ncbi:hypothetical protein GGI42DRAFT_19178 [Trichoderma sp. SZMC 28013]
MCHFLQQNRMEKKDAFPASKNHRFHFFCQNIFSVFVPFAAMGASLHIAQGPLFLYLSWACLWPLVNIFIYKVGKPSYHL